MKRLKHKETGMIYRWTPVTARMDCMEEVDIPPPSTAKPADPEPVVEESLAPEVPEVSLDDLAFADPQEEADGELSD